MTYYYICEGVPYQGPIRQEERDTEQTMVNYPCWAWGCEGRTSSALALDFPSNVTTNHYQTK